MPDEKSCGAVVFMGSRYLLLKHENGHWGFPKGNVEKGEKPEETSKREIKEETGLDIKFVQGFEEKIRYFYKRDGRLVSKEVIFFLAEARTNRVKLSSEHESFIWLPYEKALRKLTFKNSRETLKKARSFLSSSFWAGNAA